MAFLPNVFDVPGIAGVEDFILIEQMCMENTAVESVRFSEVVSALSYALDITEGQPAGHAARTCMIGMHIARELDLSSELRSALFYGLLLKDLGCSSNASKVCTLFGADDRAAKRDLKTTDWCSTVDSACYIARNVRPEGSLMQKARRFVSVAVGGQSAARELVQIRCDRGANIARSLLLPELTAEAIQSLDEHWDGRGHPQGLAGEAIPLLSRIMGLAQTVEVFWHRDGVNAACEMALDRSGTWFDPELVELFVHLRNNRELAADMVSADPGHAVAAMEPIGLELPADEAALDRLAMGFSEVVDAKSPWTFQHSRGVADLAEGIAGVLGMDGRRLRRLRRAALLHDIGKLGVSNLILDKPGKLDAAELTIMRRHPAHTYEVLRRVKAFSEFADLAAGHHERLDGHGYHKGISGSHLGLEVRILAVADFYEALAARRPYRQDLTREEAITIIERDAGKGCCPSVVSALKTVLSTSQFAPHQVQAAA